MLSSRMILAMTAESLNAMRCREAIHSGHFMVSEIDDTEQPEPSETAVAVHESDCDQEGNSNSKDFDIEKICQETTKTYAYGPLNTQTISIDASLAKLFECMNLAYSGKLTSPRWKTFKGLKLRLKDKIRLNNFIWRAWHIQFVSRKKPMVCQFASPLDCDPSHRKPEAVVMEGKYWKRKLAAVTAEYQKWRMYYKEKFKPQGRHETDAEFEARWMKESFNAVNSLDDDFFMDFSDTFFNTFLPTQPYDYPNARDIARAGFGELVQPGLVQLQPTFDDFMDTLDPLQDFFSSRLPTLQEESSDVTDQDYPDFLSRPTTSKTVLTATKQPSKASPFEATFGQPSEASVSPLDISRFAMPPPPAPLPTSKLGSQSPSPFLVNAPARSLTPPESPTVEKQARRHSYTSAPPAQRRTGNVGLSQGQFLLPKQKVQARSRSISTPQSGSPKILPIQQVQSVSLLDISTSNTNVISVPMTSKTSVFDSRLSQGGILSQNATIAQLLTSGQQSLTSPMSQTAFSCSPILKSPSTTQPHALVFTSVPLTSAASIVTLPPGILLSSPTTFVTKTTCSAQSSPSNSEGSSPPPSILPPLDSFGSSTSSSYPKGTKPKTDEERVQYKEHRRVCHINAEQKRRFNIKSGFDALRHLLPAINQNPSTKLSKAAILCKAGEYIRNLKAERQQQQEEVEILKKLITELNQSLSIYQSQLPASGAPISCQRTNHAKTQYKEYVHMRTMQNWKFWVFSFLMDDLQESFNNTVSTSSMEELCKSVLSWADQSCSLVSLRPVVLNSLRQLSTTTNVLIDPATLPEEAIAAVSKKEKS